NGGPAYYPGAVYPYQAGPPPSAPHYPVAPHSSHPPGTQPQLTPMPHGAHLHASNIAVPKLLAHGPSNANSHRPTKPNRQQQPISTSNANNLNHNSRLTNSANANYLNNNNNNYRKCGSTKK